MFFRSLLLCSVLILLCSQALSQQEGYASVESESYGLSVSVENHKDIGSFSVGGRYNGNWEKLSFNYPEPWSGTYTTINVDGKYYCTSEAAEGCTLMDQYNTMAPEVEGNIIRSEWLLPEKIKVSQEWELAENRTIIRVKLSNNDNAGHNVGARLLLDTLIGVNDGAPIYVPGSGLVTSETEYSGSALSFEYWKAYNRPDEPTIVSTGFIDSKQGYTSPSNMVIADWKRSKSTAWDYTVNGSRSILGDSAVLLYYDSGLLQPGEEDDISTGYGTGVPVLAQAKPWSITEIVLDRMSGTYCPKETSAIKVDALNSGDATLNGRIRITISNQTAIQYARDSDLMQFAKDTVNTAAFNWTLPDGNAGVYDVSAELYDPSGTLVDSKERAGFIKVDAGKCAQGFQFPAAGSAILFLASLLILIIIVAVIVAAAYTQKKERAPRVSRIRDGNSIKVVVENQTGKDIKECSVEEDIPEGAEIRVPTINVLRKNDKLIWTIGKLRKGEKAVLEYAIKNARPMKMTTFKWDGKEIKGELSWEET